MRAKRLCRMLVMSTLRMTQECHIPEWAALMDSSVPERACEDRRLAGNRADE